MSSRFPAALVEVATLAAFSAASASADAITGTPESDILLGTPQRDTIHGLAGNDDITAGTGPDQVFGGKGFDSFHWKKGDGRDRVDGGEAEDFLDIIFSGKLRLHIDALDAGPRTSAEDGLEVIGVRRLERIGISGSDGPDRLVLSFDQDTAQAISIITGGGHDLVGGSDYVDSRLARARTYIQTGIGDDTIRGGQVGSRITGYQGNDEIYLGKGADTVWFDLDFANALGHDIIVGFCEDDILELNESIFDTPTFLDTNGDGRLTAKDTTVKVRSDGMTIDFSAARRTLPPGTDTVKLVGYTSLALDRIDVLGGD